MQAFLSTLLAAALSHCVLYQSGQSFTGSCGKLLDETRTMTLTREQAITTGRWRADVKPVSAWRGEMTDREYGKIPIELEVYRGGWGILRTVYAWVPVSEFTLLPTLSFRSDATHEVRPNDLDLRIVRRAAAILNSESVWNRADNRDCLAAATKWSVYCAMEKATTEVTGGFSHRRPALEVVRDIIDEWSAGRSYGHRLMGWNNDPRTKFSEVQWLFVEAASRMRNASWLHSQGFVPVPETRVTSTD